MSLPRYRPTFRWSRGGQRALMPWLRDVRGGVPVGRDARESLHRPAAPGGNRGSSAMSEPKIVAFLCNWCSYAGADKAGAAQLEYPPNVRVIRVMCSGRVDPQLVLEAYRKG